MAMPAGVRGAVVRSTPVIRYNPRANLLRPAARTLVRPYGTVASPVLRHAPPRTGAAFTYSRAFHLADYRARLIRRHYRGIYAGAYLPYTAYGEVTYLGTPYDPSEAIVEEPAEPAGLTAPPARPRAPTIMSIHDQNTGDACKSEKVTVPQSRGSGDVEILVVRC